MERLNLVANRSSLKPILVIYDMANNRRRSKIVKFLEGYGTRVQESAFECRLEKREYAELLKKLPKYIGGDDNVRVYVLSLTDEAVTWGHIQTTGRADVLIC